ncbi:MAG: pilus assembly protein PilO [Thermosynechococcaceae cyanobacterium MS004]|nr:pilus assembly protein PilO [Thermosynechococcaceae cyanobacterium MS004]
MTFSERYSPDTVSSEPSYPSAFGISFTPSVSGLLLAIVGAGAAGWLALNFIGPKLAETQELSNSISQKEQNLASQQQTLRDIQAIVARVNQAQAKNREVRGLFSTQQSLATLLLDLNRIIVSSRAELQKFTPDYATSGTLADSSLGPELNGKLKRQVTDVAFEGNFTQTLEIMRAIDRLQTVLVLRDFKMTLKPAASGPNATPDNIVTSSFKLYAYVPLTEEELAAARAQEAAAASQQPPEGSPPPAQ